MSLSGHALVVRDEHERDAQALLQALEFRLHFFAQLEVERAERLVEQQHLRAVDQGAGQCHALTLATGELVRPTRAELAESHEVEHGGGLLRALEELGFNISKFTGVSVGGIVAALVLLVLNSVVAQLRLRSPRLRRMVEGSPTLLVLRGEVIPLHLQREGIDQETLEAALREHGIAEISEVEIAVLEIDGSISVVPKSHDHWSVKRVPKPFQRM